MKEVLVGGENSPAKPLMIADPEHHDLSTRDLPSEFGSPAEAEGRGSGRNNDPRAAAPRMTSSSPEKGPKTPLQRGSHSSTQ